MPKRCFVIGPMTGAHFDTLKWLAHELVQPIIPDFKVETPDAREIGNIMTQVIQCCDRANLVIANITGNNPNVLYEIAVLDAMGRACIPVKVAGAKPDKDDKVPFDRAAYRYFTLSKSPARRAETERILKEAIQAALAIRDRGDMFQNPLTDYFGVPLSSFSSAYALARGYYINMIKPAVKGLMLCPVQGSAYDPARFPKKVLEVILPSCLNHATRGNVERLAAGGKLMKKVEVQAQGRQIILYEWNDQQEPAFRWLDIPTTLSGLCDTVRGRLGRHANPDPNLPDYKEIEADELEQFERALLGFIRRDLDADDVSRTVRLIRWADTPLPN